MVNKERDDMHFTENERQAYNFLAGVSMKGGVSDVQEMAEQLGWSVGKAKGVVGSLVKKGKVETESSNDAGYPELWPVHPGGCSGFWGDELTQEDFKAALL